MRRIPQSQKAVVPSPASPSTTIFPRDPSTIPTARAEHFLFPSIPSDAHLMTSLNSSPEDEASTTTTSASTTTIIPPIASSLTSTADSLLKIKKVKKDTRVKLLYVGDMEDRGDPVPFNSTQIHPYVFKGERFVSMKDVINTESGKDKTASNMRTNAIRNLKEMNLPPLTLVYASLPPELFDKTNSFNNQKTTYLNIEKLCALTQLHTKRFPFILELIKGFYPEFFKANFDTQPKRKAPDTSTTSQPQKKPKESSEVPTSSLPKMSNQLKGDVLGRPFAVTIHPHDTKNLIIVEELFNFIIHIDNSWDSAQKKKYINDQINDVKEIIEAFIPTLFVNIKIGAETSLCIVLDELKDIPFKSLLTYSLIEDLIKAYKNYCSSSSAHEVRAVSIPATKSSSNAAAKLPDSSSKTKVITAIQFNALKLSLGKRIFLNIYIMDEKQCISMVDLAELQYPPSSQQSAQINEAIHTLSLLLPKSAYIDVPLSDTLLGQLNKDENLPIRYIILNDLGNVTLKANQTALCLLMQRVMESAKEYFSLTSSSSVKKSSTPPSKKMAHSITAPATNASSSKSEITPSLVITGVKLKAFELCIDEKKIGTLNVYSLNGKQLVNAREFFTLLFSKLHPKLTGEPKEKAISDAIKKAQKRITNSTHVKIKLSKPLKKYLGKESNRAIIYFILDELQHVILVGSGMTVDRMQILINNIAPYFKTSNATAPFHIPEHYHKSKRTISAPIQLGTKIPKKINTSHASSSTIIDETELPKDKIPTAPTSAANIHGFFSSSTKDNTSFQNSKELLNKLP